MIKTVHIAALATCLLLFITSCHKDKNLLVTDNFEYQGDWVLDTASDGKINFNNGVLELSATPSYNSFASAKLNFDDENAKKICFEVAFEDYQVSRLVHEFNQNESVNIRIGRIKLTNNWIDIHGITHDRHYFNLVGKTLHFEINTNQKTFKVKEKSSGTNLSSYFILSQEETNENSIEFECERLGDDLDFYASYFSVNSVKIYKLR